MKHLQHLRNMAAGVIAMLATATASAVDHSGTLPVIYINTDNPDVTLNREEYVTAKYWLDPNGVEGMESIGSVEAPLPLHIRGRGNWTWVGYDKKPYRLLLDAPASLCGLSESDYFGLHAHADDNLGFMRNTLGFELARRLGLDWTPSHAPVELYLNGEYQGLYFCTELVRVSPERVNIHSQADNDDSDVTGGWLVEIDNYDTDPHISLTEGNGQKIIISHKTPLSLSGPQEEFLRSQMTAIDNAVYAEDKTTAEWARYVDMDQLARFYIVHELMDNTEAFHGSCFIHRDRGEDGKWKFGPVWDFGSSFFRGSGKFIWQDANYTLTWIKEMYKFPEFQEKVKEVWADFCANSYAGIGDYLHQWEERITAAAASDCERWPKYGNSDMAAATGKVVYMLGNKARWLGRQWGAMPDDETENVEIFLRGNVNNWGTTHMLIPDADGKYRLELPSLADLFKIASSDFSTVDYGGDGKTELKAGVPYRLVAGSGSKNISVYGEIKDAKVTLDPVEQTLIVEGTQIEPVVPEEIPVYLRGDLNKWNTSMPFEKQPDGTYALDVEKMTGKFKIADDKFKTVNLGGDNVTPLTAGETYKLIKGGKNISLAHDIDNAHLVLDLDNNTLLVTSKTTAIESIGSNPDIERVFSFQGVEVTGNCNLAPGVYIFIDKNGKAVKRLLK